MSYKIYRWDSILPDKSQNSLPMIYIRADMALLKFAQKNGYILNVKISGTDTVYDGNEMKGTFDSLVLGPNCRLPAFQDREFHTISLESYFFEYPRPSKLGTVEIIGLKKNSKKVRFAAEKEKEIKEIKEIEDVAKLLEDDIQEEFTEYLSDTVPETLESSKPSTVPQLIVFSLILLFICILIFVLFKKYKWLE